MYCAHCGKEIKDDAAFCPECGAAVYKKEGEAAPAAPEDGNFNAAFDAGPAPQPDYAQGNPNPNPDPGAGYVYTPLCPIPITRRAALILSLRKRARGARSPRDFWEYSSAAGAFIIFIWAKRRWGSFRSS